MHYIVSMYIVNIAITSHYHMYDYQMILIDTMCLWNTDTPCGTQNILYI